LHPEHVHACVGAGVRAIHSEKPMAPTWGEAKAMHRACKEAGIQLTFCHQRRFGAHFITARKLAKEGAIGDIIRLEGFCPNLFDWATHWFDMLCFYNDETPAEWVMGQVDPWQSRRVYGVTVESHGMSFIQFANGVHGLILTGDSTGEKCSNRIIGTKGMIETEISGGPRVRVLREGSKSWEAPSLEGVVPAGGDTTLSVLDAIDCMQTGRAPTLGTDNAIRSTELIFATYESSRKRTRVKLPITIEDSPLLQMLGKHRGKVTFR
jgi:predicted dehydrogenase